MKYVIFLLFCLPVFAQNPPETDIFLFDLQLTENTIQVVEGENISQNPGYDNQPSFYADDLLLYASAKAGQTDIVAYSLTTKEHIRITETLYGSEYSPKKIPNSSHIAAVRLDASGLQRLYSYDAEKDTSSVLIPELKVGYFSFYDEHKLVAAVLTASAMDLVLYDRQLQEAQRIASLVGRSIYKVPNTSSMSYTIVNEKKNLDLYLLDLSDESPSSYFVCELPIGIQDYIWLDENRILIGSRNKLFVYDTLGRAEWTEAADLSSYNLQNITRLAVNERGTKLAFAAELKGQ